jgi:hypothetical protein
MKTNIKSKISLFLLSTILGSHAFASAPSIDSFNVQSFLKLSNNSPVSATSGDFVFALFKGTDCVWAKRYSSIAINSGVLNQKISGTGTNITSISNTNATAGECESDFSGTNLDATLLNTGSPAALSIRIYAESSIDSYKPIWDIALNSAPTAFVADTANTATTANDLAASMKASTSSGATDAGKVPVLNASGLIDSSMIDSASISLSNSQVTGLGSAATKNTGTTSGTVPLLGASGRLGTAQMATYATDAVMATDGTGVMSGAYKVVQSTSGLTDAGKIAALNSSGMIDNTMIDSTQLTPPASNLSGNLPVTKGGTGLSTITTGSLVMGAGTSNPTMLAPGSTGNVLYGSSPTTWAAVTPNTAGLVDTTNAQTIAGNKTLSGATTLSGALTAGSTSTFTGAATFNGAVTHASTTTNTGAITNNGAATFNSTLKLGASGTAYSQIITCTITSAAVAVGLKTAACTGVTTSSIVQCSPQTAPPALTAGNAWVLIPYPTAGNVNIRITSVGTPGAWTTAFTCIAFK